MSCGPPVCAPIAEFITKRHDRKRAIRILVRQPDGKPFNFAGAIGVKFIMRDRASKVIKVNASATFESPLDAGFLRYNWEAVDVDTIANYEGEFEVDYGSGVHMTVPADGFIPIRIIEDLNDA